VYYYNRFDLFQINRRRNQSSAFLITTHSIHLRHRFRIWLANAYLEDSKVLFNTTPCNDSMVQSIDISSITVSETRRRLNTKKVQDMATSIGVIGLLNPVTVTADRRLVAGYHRMEACKLLRWEKIPATVITVNTLDAELAEIDENLIRNDLTVLERVEAMKRRKEIYEAKYPETKAHIAGGKARQGSATEIISFAEDTANKLGVTDRTIRHDIQIADGIPEDVKQKLRGTVLEDKKSILLELARLPPEEQRRSEIGRAHV